MTCRRDLELERKIIVSTPLPRNVLPAAPMALIFTHAFVNLEMQRLAAACFNGKISPSLPAPDFLCHHSLRE